MLLEIRNLFFNYEEGQSLFSNLNLNIPQGKIVAVAGESGCGKSTLLNLIYGNLDWQSGEILFNGKPLHGPKANIVPGEPEMKLVAQNYDLMPYATVYDNVGKFLSNINLAEKREKVMRLLDVVGMVDYADVLPKNLSGGQQQRVAIARALSVMPKLILLDEPFSNLDFSRKLELRERLFRFVAEENLSLIISTHDLQEVLPWLDQIIILQQGRLIQNDSAEDTYRNPYNAYVARLFGEVNLFSEEEKSQHGLRKSHYFPTEILVSDHGSSANTLESRFAGSHFWNRLSLAGRELIVYSAQKISGVVHINFT